MGIFDKIYRKKNSLSGTIREAITRTAKVGEPMSIAAVYRCVSVISEGVAALPLNLYQVDGEALHKLTADAHPLVDVLNDCPDGRMNRYTFMQAMVSSLLLNGNAYAWINRQGATPRLVYLPAEKVTPCERVDENGISHLEYAIHGFDRMLAADEIIHILNYTKDGLVGISTLEYARTTLAIGSSAERQAMTYFEGNGQPSGILTIQGRMSEDQRKANYKIWQERIADNPGGVIILEGQTQSYTPITIAPADAQLLESRMYSVIDICRFFGVSPVKCFDLSKSSYATVEATQLSFLTDTLQPILIKFEKEFKRKLFIGSDHNKYEVKFDTEALLRTDKSAQASYFAQLVQLGILTPNEARLRMDLPPMKGGNQLYMQGAMATLDKLSKVEQNENN